MTPARFFFLFHGTASSKVPVPGPISGKKKGGDEHPLFRFAKRAGYLLFRRVVFFRVLVFREEVLFLRVFAMSASLLSSSGLRTLNWRAKSFLKRKCKLWWVIVKKIVPIPIFHEILEGYPEFRLNDFAECGSGVTVGIQSADEWFTKRNGSISG